MKYTVPGIWPEYKIGKVATGMIRLPHLDVSAKKFRLSEMVGTTRPRITMFMERFRNLGLVETNIDHFPTIKEKELTN